MINKTLRGTISPVEYSTEYIKYFLNKYKINLSIE